MTKNTRSYREPSVRGMWVSSQSGASLDCKISITKRRDASEKEALEDVRSTKEKIGGMEVIIENKKEKKETEEDEIIG